jgi:penicillin-binding protein 1A
MKRRPTLSGRSAVILQGLLRTFSVTVVLAVFGVLGAGLLFLYTLTRSLPPVSSLKDYQHSHATEVYSDDGKKIGEFTTEKRYPVQFERIPKHVIQAFLAAEDANFYEHKGIDYNGIFRAFLSNLLKGRYAQGGSTITQQVARALLLESKEKKITRKIREMILAHRMELELSKREILGLYLSEIYLGHGSYGIGAAARNYFHKKVEELGVPEAALLAGLPQRPRDWDPFREPANSKARQIYVLKRMLKEGFLTEKQYDEALKAPIRVYALEDLNNKVAPFFTEYVRRHLMSKYGSDNILSQGYRVYTTVKYDMQKAAEKAVEKGVREVDKRLGWRGTRERLESESEFQAFLNAQDREIIEELNPPRLMKYQEDGFAKTLEFDLSPYQDKNSRHFGPTPVAEGQIYKMLVTEVSEKGTGVVGKVGRTLVYIPLSSMEWVKIDRQPIKRAGQIFRSGDIVDVKIDKIDRKAGTVVATLEQEPEVQGALLSYEHENGFVRAMVGGRDFKKSKFNCALQAKRQVGSTFKPLIYAAAIDKGFSPSSLVTDAPIVFKFEGKLDADAAGVQGEDWKPHNFENKFEGDIPLRRALIRSMNIPTVKVLNEIGIDYAISYARTLGITSVLPRDLTIGLGSWSSSLEELMRAYAIFPRLGKPVQLVYIKRIEDSNGKVVEEYSSAPQPAVQPSPSPEGENNGLVISPQTAYVMTDMLKSVVREGTGGGAAVGVPSAVAGKTGTTNDHRDAWFVGYTPSLMAGVWIGYEKNDKALDPTETGGRAAAPIFASYLQEVSPKYLRKEFPIPDDIHFAYVDRHTGKARRR